MFNEYGEEINLIVCIGWGSLIWDPRSLEIDGDWANDGPSLPVEYMRQSNDGRLTLVLHSRGTWCTSYWVKMKSDSLDDAALNLQKRERTTENNIGKWEVGDCVPEEIPSMAEWASRIGANGTVWTSLPPKFDGVDGKVPTATEALEYLRNIDKARYERAREYVTKTPEKIQTEFRAVFEKELDWSFK